MDGYSELRDRLLGALVGLARATEGNESLVCESTNKALSDGLFAVFGGSVCADTELSELIKRVGEEKKRLVPNCYNCASPCGRNNDYDIRELATADVETRDIKSRILDGIKEAAGILRQTENADYGIIYRAFFALGEDWQPKDFMPVIEELRDFNNKESP